MRYLLVLTILLLSQQLYSSPVEETEEFRIPLLDNIQDVFGSRMNFVANRLDSFFATERADDELGRSRVRIRSFYTVRENQRGDQTNQYRINLKLPHLEEKFKYEYYQDKPIKESEIKKAEKIDKVNRGWLFNADLGVNASIPPTIVTRARVRHTFQTGTLINRFVEQITYVTDESGFIHDTSLNSDHSITTDLLFRFVNSVQWKISRKDFDTQHGPTLLHQLTENDAIQYSTLLFTTIVNGVLFANNYQAAVNYRRNLYRQWIYADFITGIDFPKTEGFNVTPFATIQLEMLIGH